MDHARLVEALTEALGDQARSSTAVLALGYAKIIDEAATVPSVYADALETLEMAARLYDEQASTNVATRAYRKVARALTVAAIHSDLGPKLLAALDALQLTPRARAGRAGTTPSTASESEDDLSRARRRRAERASRAG